MHKWPLENKAVEKCTLLVCHNYVLIESDANYVLSFVVQIPQWCALIQNGILRWTIPDILPLADLRKKAWIQWKKSGRNLLKRERTELIVRETHPRIKRLTGRNKNENGLILYNQYKFLIQIFELWKV